MGEFMFGTGKFKDKKRRVELLNLVKAEQGKFYGRYLGEEPCPTDPTRKTNIYWKYPGSLMMQTGIIEEVPNDGTIELNGSNFPGLGNKNIRVVFKAGNYTSPLMNIFKVKIDELIKQKEDAEKRAKAIEAGYVLEKKKRADSSERTAERIATQAEKLKLTQKGSDIMGMRKRLLGA